MGIFDFMKTKAQKPATATINFKGAENASLNRLTPEGELPWGWVTKNNEFTAQITKEYSHFMNIWLDARGKSPKELYAALKSFVIYLEDVEKVCKARGECFIVWFHQYLLAPDYLEKRKAELEELTANLDELQRNYEVRNIEIANLDARIIKMLKDNPGILQADFIKMFDPAIKNDVSSKLYFLAKDGKLERAKVGRSYTLQYKG